LHTSFVSPLSCAGRTADKLGDLLERQLAPQSGHDHFALLGWQCLQSRHGCRRIEAIDSWLHEPVGFLCDDRFAAVPSSIGFSRINRQMPDHTIQPRRWRIWLGALLGQPAKGILHYILGVTAPDASKQPQRGGVLIHEFRQAMRQHNNNPDDTEQLFSYAIYRLSQEHRFRSFAG
jgi:hypothetical protein